MKAIIGGAVVALSLLAAAPAAPADYYVIGIPKNLSFIEFIDADSLKRGSDAKPRIWLTVVPNPKNQPRVEYEKQLTEYGCDAERFLILNSLNYGLDGSVINQRQSQPFQKMDVVVVPPKA